MNDKGDLTVSQDGLSYLVPSTEFVSAVGKIDDIYLFLNPNDKSPKGFRSTELPPVNIPIRKGDYNKLWAVEKPGTSKKHLSGLDFKQDGEKITISGKFDSGQSNDTGGNRALGINNQEGDFTYKQSWSNWFMVRILPVKTGTLIRNVDEVDKHFKVNEIENLVDINYDALKGVWVDGKKKWGLNNMSKAQLIADIKSKISKHVNTDGLKHEIGRQDFVGTLTTDKNATSPEIIATAIYYSEKIKETLVNDPANLNPNELASIKAKIKERNKALGLSDDDITVDQSGNISIRIKDPNSKEKDGKTTVKFKESAPLVTASYPEKTVQAGDTVTSAITPSKKDDPNYKFPEGTKFELPSGDGVSNPTGLTVDPKTGEITYKAPADAEEKDVEGTINVTLPGEDKPTPIPYLIHVQRPSYAKVRYVTSDGKDIDPKFRAEAEDKYPSEIEGKRDSRVIEYAGKEDFSAPKFVGYVFEKPQVNGQNQSFNPQKNATLELVYRKIDEIIPADSGQGKPDGYVKVTFKDVEGGKLDQADADKVYFVNPKAGVKISEDGANLVGKDKNGKEQKVALPKVSPDEKYEVNYHKPSANETTTWAYDKYDQVGKEITEDKEFTAQVLKQQKEEFEPKYEDKTGIPGEEVPVEKPNFTDKDGNPTTAPNGTKYELGKDAPQGVTVNPDGSLTVKVPEGAKDGDVITVPVKVTYPDGTSDTVNAKVTVSDQSQKVEPKYKDKTGIPGEEVPVEQPSFTDKDGNPTTAPNGTKYELGKDAPQGVTVNPDGSLTVKVPEGAKDGDVITVPVKVTYPDGTTDTVNAKVTVSDQSQTVEPKYKDKVGTPGSSVKVDQPEFTGKDGNPTEAPEGTKFELGKDAPQGVTVNPDGSLTVKVPEGAKDGDVITVPVKVTYPDGTTDTVNAKVTVSDQSQ
ncbi:YPDG domain-containing protein, partial [Aerococcus urinae]